MAMEVQRCKRGPWWLTVANVNVKSITMRKNKVFSTNMTKMDIKYIQVFIQKSGPQ